MRHGDHASQIHAQRPQPRLYRAAALGDQLVFLAWHIGHQQAGAAPHNRLYPDCLLRQHLGLCQRGLRDGIGDDLDGADKRSG